MGEREKRTYLDLNATGSGWEGRGIGGGKCLATGSTVITCAANAGTMPAAFTGVGNFSIPSCSPAKTIPMPGAMCTSTSASDISTTCTVWVRASANDQVTGKLLRTLYRVNIGR